MGLGELVNVTVIIENQGTENETFTVTVYYDNTTIETQNVTNSAPNTNTTLTFTWNTTGITAATYSINATASIVSGETDIADNTLISPSDVDVVSSYIAVLPRRTLDIALTVGQNYTVSIYTNYDGSDIWGYEFELIYNPVVLHGVEVVNGDLITEEDTLIFNEGEFNNTAGKLSLPGAAALDMTAFPYVPLNSTGPGVLANVTFTVVGLGESPITLGSETRLVRVDGTETWGKFLHGSFCNTKAVFPVVAGGQTFHVVIGSNSTVSDFDFRQGEMEISFSVTGPDGTVGFCNVTIPKMLLCLKNPGDVWLIRIDGDLPLTVDVNGNETHTFLYFTYTHTTHNIKIRGTWVVPEFPTWTQILLILILLSIAITLYKRRQVKIPIH